MASVISSLFGYGGAKAAGGGNPLDDRYYEGLAAGRMSAGQPVTPETATRVGAVYRCVAILANTLAMLPRGMYEKLSPRGRAEAPQHPLDPIVSFRPNKRQPAFEFFQLLYFHLMLRQNAYAQIVHGPRGVDELIPLHPDRITGPKETASGLLRYEYRQADNTPVPLIGGVDIWHLHGLSADGLRGLSMMDLASQSIGLSMAAERHAGRFFERGVKAPGVLEHPRALKAETAREMGESFGRIYGGESGAGKTPVLWDGMAFKPTALNLKDQEFLDSRKFSVAEIARWFGVPPHMVGDVERSTSWGTGIEQQGLHFLIYSLLPWIELVEQSVRFTLTVQPERFYMKHNPGKLLQLDQKTQAEVLQILLQNGVLSANECRELLDRNPRAGGDEYMTPHKGTHPPLPPAPPADESGPAAPPTDGSTAALIALAERLAGHGDTAGLATAVVEKAEATAEARARELAAATRARELARICAARVLDREGEELRSIGGAEGDEKWKHGVACFYGRHAAYVAEALSIAPEHARAYCRDRQAAIVAAPATIQGWPTEAHDRLIELAAAGLPGPEVAQARSRSSSDETPTTRSSSF